MRFNKLDLNLLVVLDALLATRSVSRAAERIFLSQPATSLALGRLREYFDDELLVPVGKTLVPTPLAEQAGQAGARRAAADPDRDARPAHLRSGHGHAPLHDRILGLCHHGAAGGGGAAGGEAGAADAVRPAGDQPPDARAPGQRRDRTPDRAGVRGRGGAPGRTAVRGHVFLPGVRSACRPGVRTVERSLFRGCARGRGMGRRAADHL